MAYEISGKVIEVTPVQQVTDTFRKREFVIEVIEQSGQREFVDYVKFQCLQDKCELIDESYIGSEVRVSFNIKGNKWERDGKVSYFTNLDAWRIERAGDKSDPSAPFGDFIPPPSPDDDPGMQGDFEDLPF